LFHIEEPPAVDLSAVLADDGVVETLRVGRIPARPGTLVTKLAHWRDACRTGTQQAALT
jgi:hypothetical protein